MLMSLNFYLQDVLHQEKCGETGPWLHSGVHTQIAVLTMISKRSISVAREPM